MLPAPAQGAIVVVCREQDFRSRAACHAFNDESTALCTFIERDFLRALLGGCSTPISALAAIKEGIIHFQGNILSVDGRHRVDIEKNVPVENANQLGRQAAEEILQKGGKKITDALIHGKK
jgi:hydroxymethylbilane synthase